MAIPRPPGDTIIRERSRVGISYARLSAYNGQPPWTISEASRTYVCERDIRPSYNKGAVISFPGGSTFRKATSYSRESWIVGDFAPAYGYGPTNGLPSSRIREWTDSGYDGSRFLSGNPRLVGEFSIPGSLEAEAVTKALNQIADEKADMGANLATAGQTARLFTSNVGSLAYAMMAMKNKAMFKDYLGLSFVDLIKRGVDRKIAEKYLEYIYGFAPLMSDVFSLHKALKDQTEKPLILEAKGNASATDFKSETKLTSSYSDIKRLNWQSNQRSNCKMFARISPEWEFLRTLNQLGLINPAALAWELVPYSFVVDWILPIGATLKAYSAPAGLIFLDGYCSFRNSETHSIEYGVNWVGPKNKATLLPATFPVTYEGYIRKTYTKWPRPGLYIDRDPFRGSRLLQSTALLVLGLGKGPR